MKKRILMAFVLHYRKPLLITAAVALVLGIGYAVMRGGAPQNPDGFVEVTPQDATTQALDLKIKNALEKSGVPVKLVSFVHFSGTGKNGIEFYYYLDAPLSPTEAADKVKAGLEDAGYGPYVVASPDEFSRIVGSSAGSTGVTKFILVNAIFQNKFTGIGLTIDAYAPF